MPLLLRRGTNAERLLVTPQEGELIYTTDTQQLFVGDGVTLGGNTISSSLLGGTLTGNLNLGGYEINGVGNIAIVGSMSSSIGYTGNVYANNTATLVDAVNGVLLGALYGSVVGDVQGSIFSDDSTLLIDGATKIGYFNAVIGDVTGSLFANDSSLIVDANNKNGFFLNINATSITTDTLNITSSIRTDIIGSVFADNSSLLVDGLTGSIYPSNILYNSNLDISSTSGSLSIINLKNTDDSQLLKFVRTDSGTTPDQLIGSISFEQIDNTGTKNYASIGGWHSGLYISASSTGGTPLASDYVSIVDGSLIVGGYTPTEKLDVRGNAIVDGFVQFGGLTTTERNALTAANGMVIYNSTANRFQGYQNGGWINLDDGTAA